MNVAHIFRQSFLAICLSVFAASACAQAQSGKAVFEPQVGQEGKDVIWDRRNLRASGLGSCSGPMKCFLDLTALFKSFK